MQKQAKVLNRLQASSLQESERVLVNEWVGHSVPEVAAGIALALAVATHLPLVEMIQAGPLDRVSRAIP